MWRLNNFCVQVGRVLCCGLCGRQNQSDVATRLFIEGDEFEQRTFGHHVRQSEVEAVVADALGENGRYAQVYMTA